MAEAVRTAGGVPRETLRSVGIGLPGAVSGGEILYTTNIPMEDVPLAELLRRQAGTCRCCWATTRTAPPWGSTCGARAGAAGTSPW